MKTPKLKKLILSITLAVTAVVFLFSGWAFGDAYTYIDGYIGTGLAGLTMYISNGDNTAPWNSSDGFTGSYNSSTGRYNCTLYDWRDYGAWQYFIIPVKNGYVFNPSQSPWFWCGATMGHELYYTFNFTATRLYTISGTLKYDPDMQPISGVTVSIGGHNRTTDGDGRFQLNNVGGGRWWVQVPTGFAWTPPPLPQFEWRPAERAVYFDVSSNVTNVRFYASMHSLSGTVRDYSGGEISGAIVTATGVSCTGVSCSGRTWTDTTNYSGEYTITRLYNGTYNVSVNATGHAFAEQQVTIAAANTGGINFRSYAIYGYVKEGGKNGTGIDNATITISGDWNGTVSTGVGNNGYYIKSGLADGNYTVEAQATGYIFEPSSQSANINGANASNKNFYTYTIKGRVLRYGTTDGVPNVKVTITKQGETTPIATLTTNASGDYEKKGLGGGTYTIEATNP